MARNRFLYVLGLCLPASFLLLLILGNTPTGAADEEYVGTEECSYCHEQEAENYKSFSKKAHSSKSVKIMAPDLTDEEIKECFHCHTTGYGKPGGFVNFEETPDMADAGCEVCHGPGSAHVESGGDPDLIRGKLDIKECETCHNPERVENFDFKPMLYGGAH